jgi:hypothetical protein
MGGRIFTEKLGITSVDNSFSDRLYLSRTKKVTITA